LIIKQKFSFVSLEIVEGGILKGDLNNDTIFNVQDVLIMMGYVLDNEYFIYADLNADNFLNILDAIN
jgi:hypothetical protein